MPRICQITGKKATVGFSVSHSKHQSKRKILPNLQLKRLINPATGQIMRVRLTTSALKTLSKWQRSGKVFDLRKLVRK